MTQYERQAQNYRKAIDALIGLGLKRTPGRIGKSQRQILAQLRKQMLNFRIDAETKAILSTRENWALASRVALEVEEILDKEFIGPSGDLLADIKERAYKSGVAWGETSAAYNGAAQIFRGVDATNLRLIRTAALDQIVGIAEDQKQYIRDVLTKGTLENKPWPSVMDQVIKDGKVPALVVTDKNGVKRYIDMETRVQNTVRTEAARIAEVGSRDKAREIFGEDLWGEWIAVMDDRTRDRHAARNGDKKSVEEWENSPHPSDGRTLTPDEDINCRCFMRYGSRDDILGTDSPAPPPEPLPIIDKPAPKPKSIAARTAAQAVKKAETQKLKGKEWARSLTIDEKTAVRDWQGSDYHDIRILQRVGREDLKKDLDNRFSWKGLKDAERAERVDNIVETEKLLTAALDKSAGYEGTVYRGLRGLDEEALETLHNAGEITFDALASATKKIPVAQDFAFRGPLINNVIFEIETKTGIDIMPVSPERLLREAEVIIRKDARFKVVKVEKNLKFHYEMSGIDYEYSKIYLKEL